MTSEPSETGTRLTRAQLTEQVAFYKALAARATARENEYRATMTAQAEREWREEGSAPTWRVAGLGTVSASLTQDAVVVDDEAALLAWVKQHKPDEVETKEQIVATYRNALLKSIRVDAETGALVNAAGDPVPGVKLVPGGQFRGVSFLFDDETKEAYGQVAKEALSRIALRTEPTLPAGGPAGDGADALAAFAALGA